MRGRLSVPSWQEVMKYGFSNQGVATISPTMTLLDTQGGTVAGLASYANLNPLINFGGQANLAPQLRYRGEDADASNWPQWGYGANLAIAGSGTAPTVGVDVPFGDGTEKCVYFPSGAHKWYQCGDTTTGDIATEPYLYEMLIYKPAPAATGFIFGKRLAGGATNWGFYADTNLAGSYLYLQEPSAVNFDAVGSKMWGWVHIVFATDRTTCYARYNGSADTFSAASSATTVTNSGPFLIGSRSDGAQQAERVYVAYVAMWKHASLSFTTGDVKTFADQRYAELMGLKATAGGTAYPTVIGRDSLASGQNYRGTNRKLFTCAAGWMRVDSEPDSASDLMEGYRAEPQATNKCLQSEDLTTTWAKIDAGDTINANSANGPDGSATLDGIAGDATDGQHGVSQSITLTAAAWVISGFARVGDRNWAFAEDTTVANAWAYFDISNAVVGSKGAGANAHGVEDWGGGLVRWWMGVTGTAAAHTVRVCAANADNDNDFSGDGSTSNVHLGFIQVEAGSYPSSYIKTGAVTATRLADQLRYKGDDGNLGGVGSNRSGAFSARALVAPSDNAGYLAYLTDGGDTNHRVRMYAVAAGNFTLEVLESGGDSGSSSGASIKAGDIVDVFASWKQDFAGAWVDGVAGTADTTVDVPDDLDRIDIGMNAAIGAQLGGIISDIKFYPKKRNP